MLVKGGGKIQKAVNLWLLFPSLEKLVNVHSLNLKAKPKKSNHKCFKSYDTPEHPGTQVCVSNYMSLVRRDAL